MQTTLVDRDIRHLTARASQVKDPSIAREAAFKAWRTIRSRKRQAAARGSPSILRFVDETLHLPPGTVGGKYTMNPPLVKKSKLTFKEKGGVGKELSDGWVINYAIGCTFGCRFCYVDEIHKKFGFRRAGNIVYNDWGYYFAVPENLEKVIEQTQWEKWAGEEVMLSSTHDPYLPQLYKWTGKILDIALRAGVRFCIQTRSPLVEKDFELLQAYAGQVRLQVSLATLEEKFARAIEPRVTSPIRRLQILKKAKSCGIKTGIIIAPVFPAVQLRPNIEKDLDAIARNLSEIRPDHIYGESVHIRGINLAYVEEALGERINLEGFDQKAEYLFHSTLTKYGLRGRWWPEY